MKNLLLVFAVAFLIVSCEDELKKDFPNDVVNDVQVVEDQKSFKDGKPDQPGDNLKVYRYGGNIGWLFYDEENSLWAYVNIDLEDWCNSLPSIEEISIQDIVKVEDDGSDRIISQMKGTDVKVSVWEVGPIPWDCSLLEGNEPLFTGTGSFIYNDNDVNPDGDNANTWGMRIHADGVQINYRTTVAYNADEPWKSRTKIQLK